MSSLTSTNAVELFRRPPDRFLPVDGGEVAHRQVGTGPDVLFVHGWPVSGATFRCLLPHLAPSVTCHVIDLPGAGSSRFGADTELGLEQHIESVQRVVDLLGLDDVAVVGHDSGGLVARHALGGAERVRSMVLIDTEPTGPLSWRFRSFVAARHLPGIGVALGWASGHPAVRRNGFVFGDAFVDRSLLDGEFDELFLQPLHRDADRRAAAARTLRSFGPRLVRELPAVHARIAVPVHLVWGEDDVFFPVEQARRMVGTFPDATLTVIEGAGLFSHEERPAEVARALLPTLVATRRPG